MFENFKNLRASSGNGLPKMNKNHSNQENQNPVHALQNIQKIPSRSKDAVKKRPKDLPPYKKKLFNQSNTIDLRS